MRHLEAVILGDEVAVGDQVKINRAGHPGGVVPFPSQLVLDSLGCFKKLVGFQRGDQGGRGIEVGGAGIFPDRFGHETAAGGGDLDAGLGGQQF